MEIIITTQKRKFIIKANNAFNTNNLGNLETVLILLMTLIVSPAFCQRSLKTKHNVRSIIIGSPQLSLYDVARQGGVTSSLIEQMNNQQETLDQKAPVSLY